MRRTHLDRQVERIADECPGRRVSVIVQMHTSDSELKDFLAQVTEAIDARRAVTSARSLVPPAQDLLRVGSKGRITPTAKRKLEESDATAAPMFLASQVAKPIASRGLNALGRHALRPLLASGIAKKSMEPTDQRPRSRGPGAFPLFRKCRVAAVEGRPEGA